MRSQRRQGACPAPQWDSPISRIWAAGSPASTAVLAQDRFLHPVTKYVGTTSPHSGRGLSYDTILISSLVNWGECGTCLSTCGSLWRSEELQIGDMQWASAAVHLLCAGWFSTIAQRVSQHYSNGLSPRASLEFFLVLKPYCFWVLFIIIPCLRAQRLSLYKDRKTQTVTLLTSERQRCVLPDTLDFSFCAWRKKRKKKPQT
jgi:hypothetical protein